MKSSKLTIIPISLREANLFVESIHRHHGTVQGHKFSIAVVDEGGELRGVAIVGRPVARALDDGRTLEVTRVATDGCPNACSALYSASWRAARAQGYLRLGTYTLSTETGASLRAAGWRIVHQAKGGSWDRAGRPRQDRHPLGPKLRWEAD